MAETRPCAHCGDEFAPYRPWAKYCSPKCRMDAWAEAHPRVERRPRPRAQPIVRVMTAALLSLSGDSEIHQQHEETTR